MICIIMYPLSSLIILACSLNRNSLHFIYIEFYHNILRHVGLLPGQNMIGEGGDKVKDVAKCKVFLKSELS